MMNLVKTTNRQWGNTAIKTVRTLAIGTNHMVMVRVAVKLIKLDTFERNDRMNDIKIFEKFERAVDGDRVHAPEFFVELLRRKNPFFFFKSGHNTLPRFCQFVSTSGESCENPGRLF